MLVYRCPTEEVNIHRGLTYEGPLAFSPISYGGGRFGRYDIECGLMELNLDSRWGRRSNGVASSIFQ